MTEPMSKFELDRHIHNLKEYDSKIVGHESEVARLQEERREYINRHNLNKIAEKVFPA